MTKESGILLDSYMGETTNIDSIIMIQLNIYLQNTLFLNVNSMVLPKQSDTYSPELKQNTFK